MDRRLQDRFSLDGQVAVVTGAAMGMGRETTLTLARAGARVVGIDRNADVMEETKAMASAEGLAWLSAHKRTMDGWMVGRISQAFCVIQ